MSQIIINRIEQKHGAVYQYRFEIAPENGHRKYITKSGFKTKKDALIAGRKALYEYENVGISISPTELSFSDLLDYWLEKEVQVQCKLTTLENYRKRIRLYIKPRLGKYKAKTISRQQIKDFLVWMYDNGFSENTIVSCKGILTHCFSFAVDNQLLGYSPAEGIRKWKHGRKPPQVPTRSRENVYIEPEQMQKILNRFPETSHYHLPIQLGYHCGLRISEVFALTWDDIDFANKTLQVNRQIQWHADKDRTDKQQTNGSSQAGNGYWYFAEPKYGSYRVIDLDNTILSLLKRVKEKQLKYEEIYAEFYERYYSQYPLYYGGAASSSIQPLSIISKIPTPYEIKFVCIKENGKYVTLRDMQYPSKIIHKELNIPTWDFHSLRHTHATMLEEQGAPDVYVQRRLGHRRRETTVNVYTNHMTKQKQTDGNEVLNNLFTEPK